MDALVEFLKQETGRSDKALKKAITDDELNDNQHLLIACNHDRSLVQPGASLGCVAAPTISKAVRQD